MKLIEIPESLKTVPLLPLSIVGMHMSMVGWRFANEFFNYLCRNPYLLELDEYAKYRTKVYRRILSNNELRRRHIAMRRKRRGV